MHGTDAENNLHGKTGTLSGVTSIAGYVTSADGDILVFSMNSNNYGRARRRYKSIQDRVGVILANYSRNKTTG
jgi:D-alanyl-D-alanine carboxypeptidase/D-alanyl-D-alanine-endopeptidase (penicillin-binding protein 4)